ncbi:MAG: hypothetical protein BMS9Abin06_1001 [Gammaproteobacteria bacterium]|nr:MAG: hypothetical protein BMS9Abin06_1001 [Gammaproteobacteria bacterium]
MIRNPGVAGVRPSRKYGRGGENRGDKPGLAAKAFAHLAAQTCKVGGRHPASDKQPSALLHCNNALGALIAKCRLCRSCRNVLYRLFIHRMRTKCCLMTTHAITWHRARISTGVYGVTTGPARPEALPNLLNAAGVTGKALAHRLLCTKWPRHYTAKRGSDEGGKSINGAGLRLDFSITAGFCVLTLRSSIASIDQIQPWPLRVLVAIERIRIL